MKMENIARAEEAVRKAKERKQAAELAAGRAMNRLSDAKEAVVWYFIPTSRLLVLLFINAM
jgi:hypothetical protein